MKPKELNLYHSVLGEHRGKMSLTPLLTGWSSDGMLDEETWAFERINDSSGINDVDKDSDGIIG